MNGKVSDDTDYNLALKDVKSIVVLPQEQNQHQVTRGGRPEWTSRIEPNLFTLVARRPKRLENAFLLSDEEMTDRIAKARLPGDDGINLVL